MDCITGHIGGQKIQIMGGDITELPCDAYLVPQFDSCASRSGVGGAIAHAGAEQGLAAYEHHLEMRGRPLGFGDVRLTTSGGGNSKYLLHAASLDSGAGREFATVQMAVYNALSQAHRRGLKTVAMPALGTGLLGRLTAGQSARAMLSAVARFATEGRSLEALTFAIHGPPAARDEFVRVLSTRDYERADPEAGQKGFDFNAWAMQAQKAAFADSLLKQGK